MKITFFTKMKFWYDCINQFNTTDFLLGYVLCVFLSLQKFVFPWYTFTNEIVVNNRASSKIRLIMVKIRQMVVLNAYVKIKLTKAKGKLHFLAKWNLIISNHTNERKRFHFYDKTNMLLPNSKNNKM